MTNVCRLVLYRSLVKPAITRRKENKMSEYLIGLMVGSFAGAAAVFTSMWIANVEMVWKKKLN